MTMNPNSMMLVPSSNIDGYIRAVNAIPLLTAEEEHDLAADFHSSGNIESARKLVLAHLRFVVSIARGYTGYGLPLADLIQEGTVGLMKAVKRFDVSQGVRLAAFAVHWIKAEIHDYVIKNWRLVKVATTKAQRKLFFKLRQATKKSIGWLNMTDTAKVADELGVTANDVNEMEVRLNSNDVAYDGYTTDGDAEEENVPANYLVDTSSDFSLNYETSDSNRAMMLRLNEVLGKLDDRSYHIIKRRWLDSEKATLSELSEELGVSLERVRQLEKATMAKIKVSLESAE
ncbi:RNA polymerase sigma-32 factor [Ruminobacter amylophilus]|uniref:RNA polymerase sigma factor n=2 Tax=Ruminobacter TaxID=866 RepID=A0A662ZKH7_9GAMM|nr:MULTISPECIES: RNA polymerase sigma factor RpoH [Ruminobacter]SFP61479.1 RNA polymerase sigma-32 factor [Ruminobacter amylophilus]